MAKIKFDVKYRPQIESGEYRVETKAGCPVRIVCWDMACELPILGLVLLNDEKAEEMAVGFTNKGTNLLGNPLYDKLFIVTPEEEMTEFEKAVDAIYESCGVKELQVKKKASELLALAREQIIKDGYVIEKKAFHDAMENISDKHRAAMSVEYASHCKVENGTRHAIMNWEAFQKVAQKFINIGKAEALKDLPRWRKAGACGKRSVRFWMLDQDALLDQQEERFISIADLEKLPTEE